MSRGLVAICPAAFEPCAGLPTPRSSVHRHAPRGTAARGATLALEACAPSSTPRSAVHCRTCRSALRVSTSRLFSVRRHRYKGARTRRELTRTTAGYLHVSFLVDALCAVGQRCLTAISVPCVLSFLFSSPLGASHAFTDDMEDASAGVGGATPAASPSGSHRTRGSDGLLMLYAAGVGLPVRGPGSRASNLSAADARRPGCNGTLPLVAIGGPASGAPSLPLGASGRATDELRRRGVGPAAATLWLDDGGAFGVAEDSGAAGGARSPPPADFEGASHAPRVSVDGSATAPLRLHNGGALDVAADGEATGGARPRPNAGFFGATDALRLGGAAAAAHRLHDGGTLDLAADGEAAGDASGLPHGDVGESADARRSGAVSDDAPANVDAGARGGRADGEQPGALGATQRSRVPLPFVRKLRLHMDSCPGTNKSQFFFGGLGLLLACGVADCAQVLYMVVGHTKFGPDLVARSLAGIFNRSDVYNHGQLVRLFRAYATAGAYNETLLRTWKQGTPTVFTPIQHIMSYRCILLLADDGHVDLGSPVASPPPNFEAFPDPGPLFLDHVLMRECTKAAGRGLRSSVFPALRRGAYRGIGRDAVGGLTDTPKQTMLLPPAVLSYRRVRLFTRRSTADPVWREQRGWMSATTVEQVNAAIDAIKPYGLEQSKVPYGAKAESIAKMYEKYVPRRFVPDDYAVSETGASGMARAVWRQTSISPATTEQSTTPGVATAGTGAKDAEGCGGTAICPAPGRSRKMRWVKLQHAKPLADLLLCAPYNGQLPRALKDWAVIATRMPQEDGQEWEPATIKRHARVMAKSRDDLHE